MTTDELINALERRESETGSLADSLCCLGCGHEHNCGVYGCAIIREAVEHLNARRWIYVKEKLPEGGKRVIVARKNGKLVVLVISATLTECIVMRKSREYDAADNIAGLERCVKAMVVLGFVGIAAAVAYVAA